MAQYSWGVKPQALRLPSARASSPKPAQKPTIGMPSFDILLSFSYIICGYNCLRAILLTFAAPCEHVKAV